MTLKCVKSLLVAGFSVFCLLFSISVSAQHESHETEPGVNEEKKGFDANEVIFGHVLDAHEFHFFSYEGSDGTEHEAVIPLPVLLYSPQKGFSAFMFSEFHHGEHEVVSPTKYWATRRLLVSTTKLKPTKKKIVGGNASRTSCRSRAPMRRDGEEPSLMLCNRTAALRECPG